MTSVNFSARSLWLLAPSLWEGTPSDVTAHYARPLAMRRVLWYSFILSASDSLSSTSSFDFHQYSEYSDPSELKRARCKIQRSESDEDFALDPRLSLSYYAGEIPRKSTYGGKVGGVPVLLCVLCDSPLACHGHFLIYLDYTIEPHVISAARSYELHKVIHRRIRGVKAKKINATAATGTRTRRGYRTS